jgi:bacillithiol biosynthesis deacetylase BshB1
MQIDILAIAAHPDDAELACCGTLLKHAAQGRTIGILDLTRGELGSRGTATTRDEESRQATKILQLHYRENIALPDVFFENNQASLLKIITQIRRTQPKIVLANALNDRHPDHSRAAKLVADACFYAGLSKIQTEYNHQPQAPHRPQALYHYIQDLHLKPDFVVDITPYFDKKMQAIRAFASQFYVENDLSDATQPETPISSKNFWEFIQARARDLGRPINATYAEGFNFSRTVGINDLFDLI